MTTGRLDYKPGNFLRYFNGIERVTTKRAEPYRGQKEPIAGSWDKPVQT